MADWTRVAIERARAEAVKRLTAVCIATTNDLKVCVSVPAPRAVSKTTGRVYATTKATPGAPPRKVTGRGRASLAYTVDTVNLIGRVGTNVFYMPIQETKLNHKFVEPTLAKNRDRYGKILGG